MTFDKCPKATEKRDWHCWHQTAWHTVGQNGEPDVCEDRCCYCNAMREGERLNGIHPHGPYADA